MKNHRLFGRSTLVSLILALLTGCVAAWGVEPGGIREKFGKYVFTVNAYSRTGSGESVNDEKNARWRVNVGAAYPVGGSRYLLTLTSVLRGAERVEVVDGFGVRYATSLVGRDDAGGISVLKLDRNATLPSARIRPARTVRAGMRVVFLGMPLGASLAAIPGRVDAMYGNDGVMVVTVSGEPGTSGTPVFDADGLAVGLLAYHIERKERRAAPGKSYLVFPMEYAVAAARSIINQVEKKGGWLGVAASVGDLTVEQVVPGGPADKCGIRPGDRITQFNGVSVSTPSELVREACSARAGDTVRVTVIRDDETITVTPRLARHPAGRQR